MLPAQKSCRPAERERRSIGGGLLECLEPSPFRCVPRRIWSCCHPQTDKITKVQCLPPSLLSRQTCSPRSYVSLARVGGGRSMAPRNTPSCKSNCKGIWGCLAEPHHQGRAKRGIMSHGLAQFARLQRPRGPKRASTWKV